MMSTMSTVVLTCISEQGRELQYCLQLTKNIIKTKEFLNSLQTVLKFGNLSPYKIKCKNSDNMA